MADELLTVFALLLVGLGAYGVGRPIVVAVGVCQRQLFSEAVWAVALGIPVFGSLLAALWRAGLLSGGLVAGLSLLAALAGVVQAVAVHVAQLERGILARFQRSSSDEPDRPSHAPPRWLWRGALGLAAAAAVVALVAALAPPIQQIDRGQSLDVARQLLTDPQFRANEPGASVGLVEMGRVWAMALDGPVAGQALNWGLGLLAAAAAATLALPVLGRRWAAVAGSLVLLVPEVHRQMSVSAAEIAALALATLAVSAMARMIAVAGDPRWSILGGLAAGGALAATPWAAVPLAAIVVTALWTAWQHPQRRKPVLRGAAVLAALVLIVGLPWHLHHVTPVAVAPACADGQCMLVAWGHAALRYVGPLLLAALPGLCVVRRLYGLGPLLLCAAAYGAVWAVCRGPAAALVPAVGLLATFAAWVLAELRRFPRGARWTASAALGMLLALQAAGEIYASREAAQAALGRESRADYLARHVPTWPAAELVNQNVSLATRLLSEDPRRFYFDCPVTPAADYFQAAEESALRHPGELGRRLRQDGFTHVLLVEALDDGGAARPSVLRRVVEAQRAAGDRGLVPLRQYDFADAAGRRRYWLAIVAK